ncbi:RlpA-like double-psi beta-barrel-protein domain-containing protein-containing protein [Suillus americanus]|nr:RlpA-like double-psi beta-barrel-protein domain-containing protein-containing protein [Suillus americanus]
MAPIAKCLAFLSLVLSVTALTSPHISNNVFDHRRAVARVAVQAAAQTTPASSGGAPNGFLSGINAGQGTYYSTGLGACGITNKDSDYIAAVSHLLFDSYPNYDGVNPNTNPVCNQQVTATYQGKSVTVKITDRCTGCDIKDLDFSPSAFSQLADESLGRIDIDWSWS